MCMYINAGLGMLCIFAVAGCAYRYALFRPLRHVQRDAARQVSALLHPPRRQVPHPNRSRQCEGVATSVPIVGAATR